MTYPLKEQRERQKAVTSLSFSCQQVSFKALSLKSVLKIGLNINLTVRGKHYDRDVYWHR